MKPFTKLIILFLINTNILCGQNHYKYNKFIIKAKICAKNGHFQEAEWFFSEARKIKPNNYFFYVDIAKYYAQIKNPCQIDSAITNWEQAILNGYCAEYIKTEYGKSSISKSKNWQAFLERIPELKRTYYSTKANIAQMKILHEITGIDYSFRNEELNQKLKNTLITIIPTVDSLNSLTLSDLITSSGFPKYPEITGEEEFETLLLHLSMYTTPECNQIMDSLKNHVLTNKFDYRSYMHIIDRREIWKFNKKQQFGFFYNRTTKELDPIQDLKNVDEIRKQMGIPSLYEDCLLYDLLMPENYKVSEELKTEYADIIRTN